jgi:hypothetical protein
MTSSAFALFVTSFCFFGLSGLMFYFHAEFERRAGFRPPKIIYEKDVMGCDDYTKIMWQTPPLENWNRDQIAEANVTFMVMKFIVFPLIGIATGCVGLSKFFALP